MAHVLVVDDDPGFTPALAEFIRQEGFTVSIAPTLQEGRDQLSAKQPDILFVDLILPDGSGLDLINKLDPDTRTKVVIITAHPTIDRAIESLRARVYDFLIKPLDIQRLKACLASLSSAVYSPEVAFSSQDLQRESTPSAYLIGASPAMCQLYQLIEKIAPTDANVFLLGESGTGKELVAQAIHELSPRCEKPFLAVNCGAISAELIGSELFGHERGSFTGASRQHRGYFERASEGTLFLDEITEMPLELQVNLLRVLETGKLIRIGGDHEITVDARIIAATNRDPKKAVAEGKLREDLFFRLMVFPIHLPPLRDREGDIELLANHFLALLNSQQGANKQFTPAALQYLAQRPWPGNVRELRNTVQRAFILADNKIDVQHFGQWPEHGQQNHSKSLNLGVGTPIEDMERQLIFATLDHFKGNKPLTAEALGISLKTLYNRLKYYQVEKY